MLPCAVMTDKVAITFRVKSGGNQDEDENCEDEIPAFKGLDPARAEIWADILLEKAKLMYPNLVITENLRQEFIRLNLEKGI